MRSSQEVEREVAADIAARMAACAERHSQVVLAGLAGANPSRISRMCSGEVPRSVVRFVRLSRLLCLRGDAHLAGACSAGQHRLRLVRPGKANGSLDDDLAALMEHAGSLRARFSLLTHAERLAQIDRARSELDDLEAECHLARASGTAPPRLAA